MKRQIRYRGLVQRRCDPFRGGTLHPGGEALGHTLGVDAVTAGGGIRPGGIGLAGGLLLRHRPDEQRAAGNDRLAGRDDGPVDVDVALAELRRAQRQVGARRDNAEAVIAAEDGDVVPAVGVGDVRGVEGVLHPHFGRCAAGDRDGAEASRQQAHHVVGLRLVEGVVLGHGRAVRGLQHRVTASKGGGGDLSAVEKQATCRLRDADATQAHESRRFVGDGHTGVARGNPAAAASHLVAAQVDGACIGVDGVDGHAQRVLGERGHAPGGGRIVEQAQVVQLGGDAGDLAAVEGLQRGVARV